MQGLHDVLHEKYDLEGLADEYILQFIVKNYEFGMFFCEHDYKTAGLRTLLNYPDDYRFDMIIFDATIGRCFYPLIERFHNPPTAAVTPFLLPPVLAEVFGKHLYTSYAPYYATKFSNKMSIMERFLNFVYTYAETLYRDYVFLPKENALIKEKFGDLKTSLDNLERSVSLLLTNMDPVLEYPLSLPPNIVPVGGLHVKPAQRLPKDLQMVVDEAKHGVILFSLGTNLSPAKLSPKILQAFLRAFSKFPHTIIWKIKADNIGELPKNVIIRTWLPQNDILGHPNTKLFLSHGGALSTQEAIYHGVPVIGIPFFGDQHVNVRKMEEKRIAKCLDVNKLTYENIYETMKEVLEKELYGENIRRLSRLYRDQPQTALQRGVFWIEYVLRHGGAEHLIPAARDMPTYQTANVDVLVIFVIGTMLAKAFVLFAIAFCRKMLSSTKIKMD